MKMEESVTKRRYIKFRRRGITQNEEHSIQNTANFEIMVYFNFWRCPQKYVRQIGITSKDTVLGLLKYSVYMKTPCAVSRNFRYGQHQPLLVLKKTKLS